MPSLNRHEKVTRFMEFSAKGKKTIEELFSHKLFVIVWIALLRSSYCNFLRSFQILLFLTIFTQITSVNRHDKVTPFMEFSVIGKKQPKNISFRILVIISIGLLRSNYCNFLRSFQIILFLTNYIQMTSLDRHEKVTRFKEFSVNGKKQLKKTFLTSFSSLFQLHCYSQVTSILHSFQIILFLTILTQMPSLKWYQKVILFMELSVNGKKLLKKIILQVFRHYFNCKATIKLLQFLTFISDHSVFNNIYPNAFFKSTREKHSFHGIFRKW